MQDLGNDVLYSFFLDVGRPVVSYIEDLAVLPVYHLAYHRYQGSLEVSHKDSLLGASHQLRGGPLILPNKVNPKKILFFFHIGARPSSLCTDLLPGPFSKTTFISLTISNTIFPQRCLGLVR